MFAKHRFQLQLRDGQEVARQKRAGKDIPGRGAEGPRQERAWLVQGNEAKTAWAGAK